LAALLIDGLDEVRASALLRVNPDLIPLVEEAADRLTRYIPDGRFRLELLLDPECGLDEQLFLGVQTDLSENEALEALGRFDRDWWVRNAPRARGLICIDLGGA
jgi:hypothetical protein